MNDEITARCLGQSDRGSTIWKCCCGLVIYGGIDALEEHQKTCDETAIRLTPHPADAACAQAGEVDGETRCAADV